MDGDSAHSCGAGCCIDSSLTAAKKLGTYSCLSWERLLTDICGIHIGDHHKIVQYVDIPIQSSQYFDGFYRRNRSQSPERDSEAMN